MFFFKLDLFANFLPLRRNIFSKLKWDHYTYTTDLLTSLLTKTNHRNRFTNAAGENRVTKKDTFFFFDVCENIDVM